MPHDLIDRARIKLLREKTARIIQATRLTVRQCRETVDQCRSKRDTEARTSALQHDGLHGELSRQLEREATFGQKMLQAQFGPARGVNRQVVNSGERKLR